MTLEISPPSLESKPPASEAKASKAAGPGNAKPSASGGFMSILSGLDAGAATTDTLTTDTPVDALAVLATTDAPMDAAALLAQSLQWVPVDPNKVDGTGLVPNSEANAASTVASLGIGANRVAAPPTTVVSTAVLDNETGSNLLRKTPKIKADTNLSDLNADAAASGADVLVSRGPTDSRLQMAQSRADVVQSFTANSSQMSTSTSPLVGRDELVREHSIFKPLIAEGPAPVPQQMSAGVTASSGVAPTGAVTPADVYVAEQVKYWISNDVQSAEMQLDGIGLNPVEVSISMQGNEAQVTFRTDELQARLALENTSLHLKDMLQREGLVLSGVSVGTAGAGDPGSQERKSRNGARQATVTAIQPLPPGDATGSARASGRALDLFV